MNAGFVAVLVFIVSMVVTEKIKPRRDENWPPPSLMVMTKSIRTKCMKSTNTTLEAIVEFSEGEIHDDPYLKCYFNCIMNEFTIVNAEGVIDYNTMMALIPEDVMDIVDNMVKNCKEPKGDNKCEKAYNYHVCWKTNEPVHYFTI